MNNLLSVIFKCLILQKFYYDIELACLNSKLECFIISVSHIELFKLVYLLICILVFLSSIVFDEFNSIVLVELSFNLTWFSFSLFMTKLFLLSLFLAFLSNFKRSLPTIIFIMWSLVIVVIMWEKKLSLESGFILKLSCLKHLGISWGKVL